MRNILGIVLNKIRNLTKKQKILLGTSGSVGIIIMCMVVALFCFPMNSEPIEEDKAIEVKPEIVVEEAEPTVQEVPVEPKKISFSGTSIEKDLKIKIVDEADVLVTGIAFKVTVTAQKANEGKEYTDDNMDGIIYITDIASGKYVVQLHDVEGFLINENSISMTVKDKIEYKKVDVKNEIKQASEVDIEKEDAPAQKPQEETKIENTVELLESTTNVATVAKEKVDFSNFPKASKNDAKEPVTILNTTTVNVPESILLYSQGGDDSKIFLFSPEIADENQVIQQYSWKTDVDEIITVTENEDKTVNVFAMQPGTVNLCLTVLYEDGITKSIQSKEIQIAVTVSELTDDKTQLRDHEGFLLYLDKELKQAAMLKDYSGNEEYYTPKYTGWQTIDDKLYYYDKNHTAVTGVQIIGGARYTFGEDGALLKTQEQRGIDVSKWQGNIDWNAVANAGIDFAIIRAGNRGSSTGVLIEDPYFKKNIEGATKAGIKVGVYVYSQAITEAEAIEEASMALSLIKGYRLQLPIYFDTEYINGGRANSLSVSARTAITKAFCETIRNAGYMPGIYSNYYWLRDNLKMSQLEMYSVWVAHYADKCGYPGRYDMWQYTSSGSVPGISGRVDLNISYVGY